MDVKNCGLNNVAKHIVLYHGYYQGHVLEDLKQSIAEADIKNQLKSTAVHIHDYLLQ